MRHVITLSTIPPRFSLIGPTLRSLVAQRSRPEAVELYIPRSYRRFPQWGGGLPDVPPGVTIIRVDEDFGPATKILPAVRRYRGQDVDLLFVDDDHHYPPGWAAGYLEVRRQHPEAVVCASALSIAGIGRVWVDTSRQPRARPAPPAWDQLGYQLGRLSSRLRPVRLFGPPLGPVFRKFEQSGYVDVAEGFAGVALRPEFLDDAAFTIPSVLWTVDDVWISGHLARRGIPIWADSELFIARSVTATVATEALYTATIDGANRAAANRACVDYFRETYGIWGGSASQSA